ncbi:MAG: carbohydrate binding family 9 domain-containing protein [Gammaproteobacteria bacterium]
MLNSLLGCVRHRLATALLSGLIIGVSTAASPLLYAAITAADSITGVKVLDLRKATSEPTIDGVLDEEVWQHAVLVTDFHQMSPVEYGSPSQRTEVRVFYTDNALYVGARMYESDPALIRANVMRQGQTLQNDDAFNLMVDSNFDRRSGYLFELNANGVRVDGIYQNVTQVDRSWNGIWQAKSQIDAQGWTTEIRIPFQTLSFNPNNSDWGINFRRTIRRTNEEIAWVSSNRLINPGAAGTASGLTGLHQGLGLDVVPYLVARQSKVFGPQGYNDNKLDPQLDVYYKITPQLNAALTVNTDFSATEVDDRVVNLSRFNLFFPERRDFFIRDTDIFQFGRIGNGVVFGLETNEAIPTAALQNGRPFFSRNMGLSASGQPVDIKTGAKVSGRVGAWNLGALMVRQDEDVGSKVDAQTMLVGRASLNVLQESQIGVIATQGDAHSNNDNSLVGADFRYRNSHLPGGSVMESEVWYQQTDSALLTGDNAAYGFGISAPNSNGWRGAYNYKRIQNNFNPALGFVNQRDIEDHALDFGYRQYLMPGGTVRSVYGGFDSYRNLNGTTGDVISETFQVRANANNNSNDVVAATLASKREVLSRNFVIYRQSDGTRNITIAPGDYRFTQTTLSLTTAGQREWATKVALSQGDYYNGENLQTSVNLTWLPRPGYSLQSGYSENRIQLPQGDFLVRQWSFTSLINFTPDITWTNRVQYDNISESMSLNSRLYWIPEPGREAYLVLNWGLVDLDKDNDFTSTNRDLTLKYNYTFRF